MACQPSLEFGTAAAIGNGAGRLESRANHVFGQYRRVASDKSAELDQGGSVFDRH
jgi:hypothetical protein